MKGPSCDWGGPVVKPWWALVSLPLPPLPRHSSRLPEAWPAAALPFPTPQASTFQLPSHQLHPGLASEGTATRSLKFPTPSSPQFSADQTTDFPSRPIPLQFSTTLHSIWGR